MADWITSALTKVRNRHVLLCDTVIVGAAPSIALILRTEELGSLNQFWGDLLVISGVFLALRIAVFYRFKLYQRLWRYASVDEMARMGVAGAVAITLQLVVFFLILRPFDLVDPSFPRSVPLIEAMVSLPLMTVPRFAARLAERIQQRNHKRSRPHRVVVAGAGEAGVMIVKEMQANPRLGLRPVAFVDDDADKQSLRIRGIEVDGTTEDLPKIAAQTAADRLVVAMPTATGKKIRRISELAQKAGLSVRVIPGMYELLDGTVHVSQLRPIQVEDLLRRPPVTVDTERVDAMLAGKTVLVTGAGGSIGSELCRQILRARPAKLVLVGQGETSVFRISQELSEPDVECHAVIANIRDKDRLGRVLLQHRPQIVFHAAAHKHVPLMEQNPDEAVTNNVLGTRNLLETCEAADVERFVMISTDKAVNPANVMGSTKRIAEMLVYEAAERLGRPYVAVRFGNVLGSRGSVLETFKQQIAGGGPITVTHPEMRRYFMTIPEAVTLVLQAGSTSRGGEVFVLDMGDPVKIADMARDLIQLSGLKEGEDIDLVFTGLRPGEKLFEELFLDGEEYVRTEHRSIFVCVSAGSSALEVGGDGAGAGEREAFCLSEHVQHLVDAAQKGDQESVLRQISLLVPTFRSSGIEIAV